MIRTSATLFPRQVNDGGVIFVGNTSNPLGQGAGNFGFAVDSTGGTCVIASAVGNQAGPVNNAGAAYLYAVDTADSVLNLTCSIISRTPQVLASFGESVAVAGGWVVVSSATFDNVFYQDGLLELFQV